MYGIYWVVLKVLKKIKDHEVTFLKRNFLKTSIYTTDAYLAPYCLPTRRYAQIGISTHVPGWDFSLDQRNKKCFSFKQEIKVICHLTDYLSPN